LPFLHQLPLSKH